MATDRLFTEDEVQRIVAKAVADATKNSVSAEAMKSFAVSFAEELVSHSGGLVDMSANAIDDIVDNWITPGRLKDMQHQPLPGERFYLHVREEVTPKMPDGRGNASIDDVYANRLKWRGRNAEKALETEIYKRWLEMMNIAKPLVPEHERNIRTGDLIVGHRPHPAEIIESITIMDYGSGPSRIPMIKGTSGTSGSTYWYCPIAPVRQKPLRPGSSGITHYPEEWYKSPHEEFWQTGGIENKATYTGKCIFAPTTGERLWERNAKELYEMLIGQSDQTAVNRRDIPPKFYAIDKWSGVDTGYQDRAAFARAAAMSL